MIEGLRLIHVLLATALVLRLISNISSKSFLDEYPYHFKRACFANIISLQLFEAWASTTTVHENERSRKRYAASPKLSYSSTPSTSTSSLLLKYGDRRTATLSRDKGF